MGTKRLYTIGDLRRHCATLVVACEAGHERTYTPFQLASRRWNSETPWRDLRFRCYRCDPPRLGFVKDIRLPARDIPAGQIFMRKDKGSGPE